VGGGAGDRGGVGAFDRGAEAVVLQAQHDRAGFVGHRVGQRGVTDRAGVVVDGFHDFAAAGASRTENRGESFFSAGFRPGGVRSAGGRVGDRLQLLPGLFFSTGAGESFFVGLEQVVLELVARARTVFADDAGDRDIAGTFGFRFSRVELVPGDKTTLEDGGQ